MSLIQCLRSSLRTLRCSRTRAVARYSVLHEHEFAACCVPSGRVFGTHAGSQNLSGSRSHVVPMSVAKAQRANRRGNPFFEGAAIAVSTVAFCGVGAAVCEAAQATESNDQIDFSKVRSSVAVLLEQDPDFGPTLVRLGWHASGTYDRFTRTGGSNGGTIRFEPESGHGANAGLSKAMARLEPIKAQFGAALSYGDLYTFASAVAIEHMGGPAIAWRPGRMDAVDGSACTPDGRLPDAEVAASGSSVAGTVNHLRTIFGRMGFNDQELVALSGAHALGRCHPSASGYTGPWTRAPTTFSNEYFRELLENTWTLKKWDGPIQYEDPSGDLMMLPSDMALIWDRDLRGYVELYAKNEEKFFEDFAAAFSKLLELGVARLESSSQRSVVAQRLAHQKEELVSKLGEMERAAASARAVLEEQLFEAQRAAGVLSAQAGEAAEALMREKEAEVRELEQALYERVKRDAADLKNTHATLKQKIAEEQAALGKKLDEKAKEIKKSWWG